MAALSLVLISCTPPDDGAEPLRLATPDAAVADASVEPIDASPDAMTAPVIGAGAHPIFAFPVHPEDRWRIHPALFFGVDHDPAEGDDIVCTAYDGRSFPFCYDGHAGSDFLLAGGFTAMDDGSARVIAAAGGEVIRVVDGNYDRCHGDLGSFEPDCDGYERASNRVHLRHANGWVTEYLHLMNGSVTVELGDRVACGDVLGRVGSSGRSFAPHLHFEVVDPELGAVDPFSGDVSGPRSLWGEQRTDDDLPGAACDPAWGAPP